MPDDELTAMLWERQRKAACEAAGIPYVPDVLAVREAANCDPDTPEVPDTLLEANPLPVADPPERVLPLPLLVRSPAVTVECEFGIGSATSAYGESSIELYLDDVPELTRSELYRISDNHAALQAALDSHLEPLAEGAITNAAFDAAIMAASTMEATAAAGVRVKALELRGKPAVGLAAATGLYAIAELTAVSRLVCTFDSEAIWVVCDSTSDTGFRTYPALPSPAPAADRFRTRPAGFRTSTVSVEDANALAALDAVSDPTFVCVYLNAAVTATCASDVDAIYDHTYVPAFDWNGSSYASLAALGAAGFSSYALDSLSAPRPLVYSFTIAGGLFTASSQADADSQARAAAIRQLSCFFPSRVAVVDCENRSADNPVKQRMLATGKTREQVFTEMDADHGSNPDLVTNFGLLPLVPGPGSAIDATEGLIVKIPAGLVSSTSSPEDADDEAVSHALGFLSCFWVSPRVTCSCLDSAQAAPEIGSFEYTDAQLEAMQVVFNAEVSSSLLTYEKGALGSSEDDAIPVGDAMGLCRASLVCVYCNQTIEPRCSVAYTVGGLEYNLWQPQTDANLPISLTTRDGVSTGVSAGLPSLVICDSDPRSVNTLAVATASLPPVVNTEAGDPKCLYGNREVTRTCVDKVGANAYGLTPESAGRSLTVSAGSFEAETQIAADALAETFIDAALVCEFGNPPMIVRCGATSNVQTISAGEYSSPVTYGTGMNVIAPTAVGGVTSPLSVNAHVFTSLESPLNAKAQALLSLVTQLDCFWRNAKIELRCGASPICPALSTIETGTITSGTNQKDWSPASHGSDPGEVFVNRYEVTSYASQAEANAQAYSAAYSQLDCFWESAQIDLMCTASPTCPAGVVNTPETGNIQNGDNSRNNHPDSTGAAWGDVRLDRRTFSSYSSQAEANRQAYAMAYSMLDCYWKSAQIELMCDAAPVCPSPNTQFSGTIQDGSNARNFSLSSTGAVSGQVSVAREMITSYVSQSDANNQAYAIAYPQLDCFWQNARIELMCGAPPVCPDQSTQEIGTISAGTNEEDYSDASFGATAGQVFLAASHISSYQSQEAANSQAYSIAYDQLDCFWQNAKLVVMCGAPPVCPNPSTPETGQINAGSNQQLCSLKSNGAKATDIVIAAATVDSYTSQADANYQAYEMGYPQLDCFWLSAKIDLLCGAPPFCPPGKNRINENGTITEGSNRFTERLGESTYSDRSTGFKLGDAMLAAETIQSYVSQSDANNQAYSMVWPMLDCFWENAKMVVWCTPPPTLGTQFRLYTPNGSAYSGSGPMEDPVTVNARDLQSYRSQEDANVRAYFQAKDQLICQSATHPFALSGSPTFACCKTAFNSNTLAMVESGLYNPPKSGENVTGVNNGYTKVDLDLRSATACSFYPAYFYLEAVVSLDSEEQYRADSAEVVVSRNVMSLLDGSGGAYTKVRRLIAEVSQDDTGSVFNNDARDECGGLRIAQSVTTAQKIATSTLGGKTFPVIADLNSPLGGGGGGGPVTGAFYGMYSDADGNRFLQGGYVSAGTGSETVPPFKIMTAPASAGGEATWRGSEGQHVVLTVTGTGLKVDGVLMPQFNMSNATVSVSSSVGDQKTPTVSSTSGTFKTSLGVFGDKSFLPNLPGNLSISFCVGGFTSSRS